jgi:hypothetical protein
MKTKEVDEDIDSFEFIERIYAAMNIAQSLEQISNDCLAWNQSYKWTTFQKVERRYSGKELIEALQLLETYTEISKKWGELLNISKVQS